MFLILYSLASKSNGLTWSAWVCLRVYSDGALTPPWLPNGSISFLSFLMVAGCNWPLPSHIFPGGIVLYTRPGFPRCFQEIPIKLCFSIYGGKGGHFCGHFSAHSFRFCQNSPPAPVGCCSWLGTIWWMAGVRAGILQWNKTIPHSHIVKKLKRGGGVQPRLEKICSLSIVCAYTFKDG